MKLGVVSDSLAFLSFEEMLNTAVRLGFSGVEMNCGGRSPVPHLDRGALLRSPEERARFLDAFGDRGLALTALNACGNPLHPADRTQADALVDTLRLAGELGVDTVVTNSGLPAGNPTDTTPNWVVTPWPPETLGILQYQWEEVLLPFWTGIAALAKEYGVRHIALMLHGNQCVHNVPTLLKLREMIGPQIGAGIDPASMIWMGADPHQAAAELGETIFHVHARDCMVNPRVAALSSRLDPSSPLDLSDRAWNHATVGFGRSIEWWAQFCYWLRLADFDAWVNVQQDDLVLNTVEGLGKSAEVMKFAMPGAAPDRMRHHD
jgi:sugar phosphate isomerase/epimerase